MKLRISCNLARILIQRNVQNVNCISKTTLRGQSTQYYTDANDRLTCKVPKSNELVPSAFMLAQLIYFVLLKICKELIGCISVSIMFTFG